MAVLLDTNVVSELIRKLLAPGSSPRTTTLPEHRIRVASGT